MKREKMQENCALCGSDNGLRESHIIPKLVYKRIKSQPKSRFRVLGDPKQIMNDGDKVHMLCSECELFMSKYETFFANNFFDDYLKGNEIKCLNDKRLIDLITIINWRVIYDDLYLFDSISTFADYHKQNLIKFEEKLRNHLLKLKKSDNEKLPDYFLNELCDLILLRFNNDTINYFKNLIFGYTYFDEITGFYTIISHFAGVVLSTRYKDDSFVYINVGIDKKELKKQKKFTHYSIQKELIHQYKLILEQKKLNDELLDDGLREKIKKYLGI